VGAFASLRPSDGRINAFGGFQYGGSTIDGQWMPQYNCQHCLEEVGCFFEEGGDTGICEDCKHLQDECKAQCPGALTSAECGAAIRVANLSSNYSSVPADEGYTYIYSSEAAFAAMKVSGSIRSWGDTANGGSGAPTDSGYVRVSSTASAFAATKQDGTISVWGNARFGGTGGPSDAGYVDVVSTNGAFAARKADGAITVWGYIWGRVEANADAPVDAGYLKMYSNYGTFVALKGDGSARVWGDTSEGKWPDPFQTGWVAFYTTMYSFAGIDAVGAIAAFGAPEYGGKGAPSDNGYTSIYSSYGAFAALKGSGHIRNWGNHENGGPGGNAEVPLDGGYVTLASNKYGAVVFEHRTCAFGCYRMPHVYWLNTSVHICHK
jgi:hypothetical protein